MQETLTERSLGRRQAGEVSMSGQEGRGGEPAGVSKSHLDERRRGGQPRRQSARALARGGGSPRLMRLHQAGGLGVYLDLVQGSHSGRGRRNRFQEKRILCVSPKAGPVPPAAPSGAYI